MQTLQKKLIQSGISQDNWESLKPLIRKLNLQKGEYFVREGETPFKIGYIVKGVFKAYYLTDKGDEKTIIFRDEGHPISALSSKLDNVPAKFSIVALEDSELFYISIKDFNYLCKQDPFWEIQLGKYYIKLFIEKEERERALLSDDALTRYKKFQQDFPGLENRINQYEIASYLGISNVSLSRIRGSK